MNTLDVYLACAGHSKRITPHKLIQHFGKETLPERQIRMLNERGIKPKIIINPHGLVDVLQNICGDYEAIPTYNEHRFNSIEILELYESWVRHNKTVLYLCGDLYYSENNLDEMLKYDGASFVLFGQTKPSKYQYRERELYGFKVKPYKFEYMRQTLDSMVKRNALSLAEWIDTFKIQIYELDECSDYDNLEDLPYIEHVVYQGKVNKKPMSIRFKQWTRPVRHLVVRYIAPHLYYQATHNILLDYPRPMIFAASKIFGPREVVGCEIGVDAGENAYSMICLLNVKQLYLIDPYQPYYQDGIYYNSAKHEEEAHTRLEKYPVTWVKKRSQDAANDIPALDFCYIDGNHEYAYVLQDLNDYYPKVKTGGIFGGHDYNPEFAGVIEAVRRWSSKEGLKVYHEASDWWIIKP